MSTPMSHPNPSKQELAQLVVNVLKTEAPARGLHSYIVRNCLQLDRVCYVKTKDVHRALLLLEKEGRVSRSDSGLVGSPYRYSWSLNPTHPTGDSNHGE